MLSTLHPDSLDRLGRAGGRRGRTDRRPSRVARLEGPCAGYSTDGPHALLPQRVLIDEDFALDQLSEYLTVTEGSGAWPFGLLIWRNCRSTHTIADRSGRLRGPKGRIGGSTPPLPAAGGVLYGERERVGRTG